MPPVTPVSAAVLQPVPRPRWGVLGAILVAEVLILCLPATWWAIAAAVLLAVVILVSLLLGVIGGRGEGMLLGWVLIFPLGYHYLAYPQEQAVITLDRILIGILLAAACFAGRKELSSISPVLRKSAVYWGWFLVLAALTIPRTKGPLSALHILLDALLFPGVLAWYVVQYFDVRKHLASLHILTCLMSTYVAGIALAEVLLQRDLIPVTGGGLYFAGDYQGAGTEILIRPNGPFSTDNSLALIGLVSLFFMLFLKNALGEKMPGWQKLLHRVGTAGAMVSALLPLFRSVVTALVAAVLIDAFYQRGKRRMLRLVVVLGFGFAFVLMRMALPEVFEERTDPEHFYGRIAQNRQTLTIFLDNPIVGVGLNNFGEAAQNSKYISYYQGYESVDSPHSNLGAVLAETGLVGMLPFVASQVLLVWAFWDLCPRGSPGGTLVWKTFLFVFSAYAINGLTLTIIYSSDLNIWYMFVLAVLFKFSSTGAVGSWAQAPKPILVAQES